MPQLFDIPTLECKNYTEVKCKDRFEPKDACKLFSIQTRNLIIEFFLKKVIIKFVHQLMLIHAHIYLVVKIVRMVYIPIVYVIVGCIFVVHQNVVLNLIHVHKIHYH